MFNKLFHLLIGYGASSALSLAFISYLSSISSSNILPIAVFTTFSLISLFDFGISRTVLNVSSTSILKLSSLLGYAFTYLIFVTALSISSICLITIDHRPNLILSISAALLIALCGLLSLSRVIFESRGKFLPSSLIRFSQTILLTLTSYSLIEYNRSFTFLLYLFAISLLVSSFYILIKNHLLLSSGMCFRYIQRARPIQMFSFIKTNYLQSKIYKNILLSSLLVTFSNLADRFAIPYSTTSDQLVQYLSLSEYVAKVIALSTLFSSILFAEISSLQSSSSATSQMSLRKTFLPILLRQSLFVAAAIVLVFVFIYLHVRSLFSSIGLFPIILILSGAYLNTIAGLASTYLEALSFLRLRTIAIFTFICLSLLSLVLFLFLIPFPFSVSFYWLFKGLVESTVLFFVLLYLNLYGHSPSRV